MDITTQEAEIYCRMELRSCGLKDFSIVWIEKSRTLGLCMPWDKQIHISKECLRSAELLREVLLHEAAHALQWYDMGKTYIVNGRNSHHNKIWKRYCLILGIRPRRLLAI
jgi:hypothetical protein